MRKVKIVRTPGRMAPLPSGAPRSLLPGEDSVCWPADWLMVKATGPVLTLRHRDRGTSRRLHDLVSGYGAFNFGHAHPKLMSTLTRALRTCDGALAFATPAAEQLSARLLDLCGYGRGHAYFTVGGSQSVEIALRIGRIVTKRPRVAVLQSGFHGYGSETIHLSRDFVGHTEVLDGLGPSRDVLVLPFDHPKALEILTANASTVGTLLVEPLLGAGGFRMPSSSWFTSLLQTARTHGIFTIIDEIQVGMGRTGRVLAHEHHLPTPQRRSALVDAVVLSKSLAGGLWPLSAIVLNGARLPAGLDLNQAASLGETFSNNPVGCAVALEALDLLTAKGSLLLRRVNARGQVWLRRLEATVARHRPELAVRGLGMCLALDFPSKTAAQRFVTSCFDLGALAYVCGGRHYASVKLIPPLILTDDQGRAILDTVIRALRTSTPGAD